MEIPPIGLGTYRMADAEACADAVATAVDIGYDHIDTAQSYGNEGFVADGLAAADRDADGVFVAPKLDTDNLGYDDVVETAHKSADRLGVDSLDLLYVHWPLDTYDPEATLPALDAVVDEGVVDRIGVSNFRPDQLRAAIDRLETPIAAHQVEMHPLLPQPELHDLAVEHGHELLAYCPIARGTVSDADRSAAVAGRSPGGDGLTMGGAAQPGAHRPPPAPRSPPRVGPPHTGRGPDRIEIEGGRFPPGASGDDD